MQMSRVTRSISTRPLDVSKYFVVNNMDSDDLEKNFINDFIGMVCLMNIIFSCLFATWQVNVSVFGLWHCV